MTENVRREIFKFSIAEDQRIDESRRAFTIGNY